MQRKRSPLRHELVAHGQADEAAAPHGVQQADKQQTQRVSVAAVATLLPEVPRWAYMTAAALSWFMVVWIFLMPASWVSGFWTSHAEWLEQVVPFHATPVPRDVMLKYKGQWLVSLLHQLPAGLWALATPLQLNTTLRNRWLPLHRWLGRVTAATALLLSAGFVLMQSNGVAAKLGLVDDLLVATTAWFLFSMMAAVVTARARYYTAHRAWVMRHVAAGVWVSLDRWLLGALDVAGRLGLWMDWDTAPEQDRVDMFGACMAVSIVACVVGCEVLLGWEAWRGCRSHARVVREKEGEGGRKREKEG